MTTISVDKELIVTKRENEKIELYAKQNVSATRHN